MKTSSCKAKGRILQQLVAKALAEVYDLSYGPDQDVGSREMGQSGTDVKLSPLARTKIAYNVECKNGKSIGLWGSWAQTIANTGDGRVPLLVMKRNRQEPLAILTFEHLITLLKKQKMNEKVKTK